MATSGETHVIVEPTDVRYSDQMFIIACSSQDFSLIEIEDMTLFALGYSCEEMTAMTEFNIVAIADVPVLKFSELFCSHTITNELVSHAHQQVHSRRMES
jgi:hypothetical protein